MDLREARTLLEVEAGVVGTELKRAYMRKVKLFPPERQPEQFERVRRAYELLNSPQWQPAARDVDTPQTEAAVATSEDGATSDADVGDDEPIWDEFAGADGWMPFDFAEQPRSEALDKLSETLKLEGILFDPLLELLKTFEPTETQPACYMIMQYLWRHERGYLVEEFLLSASRAGVVGLEQVQIQHCPQVLSTEQLHRFMHEPIHAFTAERELASRGDEGLIALYEQRLAAVTDHSSNVEVAPMVRLVLGLQAAERQALADALLKRVNEALDIAGSERALAPADGVQLQVARELSSLPHEATEFRRIVARAMLARELTSAESELAQLARRDAKRTSEIRDLLRTRCPVLQELFSASLGSKRPNMPPVWLFSVVLLFLMRGCIFDVGSSWYKTAMSLFGAALLLVSLGAALYLSLGDSRRLRQWWHRR